MRTAPRLRYDSPSIAIISVNIDHVIVLSQAHLRRVLAGYLTYYDRTRTHLALAEDAPHPRSLQPPEIGDVIAIAEVGGLDYRYESVEE